MLNWAVRYRPVIRLLAERGARTVLDVGSGNYGITWYRPGWAVQTDLAIASAATDPRAVGDPSFVVSTGEDLPFAGRSFDAVVSLDLLEHLPDGLRAPAVAEMARVARRIVVVACPIGATAERTDNALSVAHRLARKDRPAWLDEHLAQESYPTSDTVRAAVPPGWGVTAEMGNANAAAYLAVLVAEMFAGGIAGSGRKWRWPAVLDRGPSYRRIFVLERDLPA